MKTQKVGEILQLGYRYRMHEYIHTEYITLFNMAFWMENHFLSKTYLIDVRDEFALSRNVDFLIVCSHLALDSKEENLQVSFLCKSVETDTTSVITCCTASHFGS